MPSCEWILLTQRHRNYLLETRDSRLSYGEDPESLSHLALNPYCVVTDKRTDRQNRHSQYVLLPVQLWRVKTKSELKQCKRAMLFEFIHAFNIVSV